MEPQQPSSAGPDFWYAVRVRSNFERITASHLRERGYEEFSPSYKVQRRWSDRTKTVEQFLFPGYVFARLNPHNRLLVVTSPGVVGLVGLGKTPTPIPDQEIENIRTLVRSGLLMKPWPYLEVGQHVLIEGTRVGGRALSDDDLRRELATMFLHYVGIDSSRPQPVRERRRAPIRRR